MNHKLGKFWGGLKGFGPVAHPALHFKNAVSQNLIVAPPLPDKTDLSDLCGTPLNQYQVGDCLIFAFSEAREFLMRKHKVAVTPIAENQLYEMYRAKFEPAQFNQDTGGINTQVAEMVPVSGYPMQKDCPPYDPNNILLNPPSQQCIKDALTLSNVKCFQLQNPNDYEYCLAAGYPFVLGMWVFENFYDAQNNGGYIPMPEGQFLGGHAMLAIGYEPDPKAPGGKWLKVRNSWGTDFTKDGDVYIPWEYLTYSDAGYGQYFSDCWVTIINTDPQPYL